MGKNKVYVYWRGDEVHIANSWDEADRATKRVFNGHFESFNSREEAVEAIRIELAKTCRKLPSEFENDGWPALW